MRVSGELRRVLLAVVRERRACTDGHACAAPQSEVPHNLHRLPLPPPPHARVLPDPAFSTCPLPTTCIRPDRCHDRCHARYTAYTKELVDFIMDSTHPTADDWRDDRALWSEELKDFCRCVRFEKMDVLQHRVVNDDVEMVTFAARMVVLEDLLRPELVQTKEFTERAKFIKEDGRWFYAGGDEDFEPTNVVVAGPPDKPAAGGGGMKGKVKAKAKSKSKAKAKAR